MKALVVVDGHLFRTPDGRVWSERIYDYSFFARYLMTFESIRVAMRIKDVQNNEEYPNLCSGKGVEFFPIEEFKGPKEYILKYPSIQKNIKNYFCDCDCGIFRIPSTVGYQFWNEFKKTKKPYAVEVVVDPWDFAAPGRLSTPLRPAIRWIWTSQLKKACMEANGVSYVTQFALQNRYPSRAKKYGETEKYFEEYYSSANIPESFYGTAKIYPGKEKRMKIVHVANSISNHVKGHEELISAVAILKRRGIDLDVEFIGEGTLIEHFKKLAEEKDVSDRVYFIGKLSTPQLVREALSSADLFVFPSHAEGLPRVLIEAMAVGLPAISTRVNGIPELLEDEYLVNVGEIEPLADKIQKLALDKDAYNIASRKNLEKAHEYCEVILQARRQNFYMKLRRCVEQNNEE